MTNIDSPDLDYPGTFNWTRELIYYYNCFSDYTNSQDVFCTHNIFKDPDIRL